ncbi:MAG: DUF599 family protein [Planctomycetota bacterium]
MLGPVDLVALGALTGAFPLYHMLLPWLRKRLERYSTGKRAKREMKSWIESTVGDGKVIVAVQQTRNTTMVASLLASSSLIIMTLSASLVIHDKNAPQPDGTFPLDALSIKAMALFVLLAIAFSSFVQCLNGMGRFTVMIGCELRTLDRTEGDGIRYLVDTFLRAVRSYRVGIRHLHAVFPIFFWLFDPRYCIAACIVLWLKFFFTEDFVWLIRKRPRPVR